MTDPQYRFEIIHKDWAKRRKPRHEPAPVSVTIDDFELKQQHFCNMQVVFDDGSEKTYFARVIQNHITKQWTVDGMHVAVKVLEVIDVKEEN